MADYCKQCSIEEFGEDYGDLANLGKLEPGYYWIVLCEGCGLIQVDNDGVCVSLDCYKLHGANNATCEKI